MTQVQKNGRKICATYENKVDLVPLHKANSDSWVNSSRLQLKSDDKIWNQILKLSLQVNFIAIIKINLSIQKLLKRSGYCFPLLLLRGDPVLQASLW